MNNNISIIGVPTDIGAGRRGANMGPDALRIAQIIPTLVSRGLDVKDCGNLAGPDNPWSLPVNGYRHLSEVVTWNEALYDAVYHELNIGRMPVVLGGDHCLAIGSISAVARHCRDVGKKLRIIWLDAHTDFNINLITPTGNIHGMPVTCLCGHGPQELLNIGGVIPAINHTWIKQIGIRSVDPAEKKLVDQIGIEVYDMRYIDEYGIKAAMELALRGINSDTHLHVSFDIDFLDPGYAPGVGTREPGGPTYREARLCMEMIHDTGLMASLDIVEVNPAMDTENKTALVAVDLVDYLFGKHILIRK